MALVPGPIVNRVAPNKGAVDAVTITGNHFTNAGAVNFGQHAGARCVDVVSDREITVDRALAERDRSM